MYDDDVLPHGPTDLVYTSLYAVVFQLEGASAAPIAYIIRKRMNDGAIFEMIQGVSEPQPAQEVASTGPASRARQARIAALKKEMREARLQHSAHLQERDMQDVDIVYKVDKYHIEPVKTDKEIIEATEGRTYHVHPFRPDRQEMALSVLISAHTLARLFPDERCAESGIEIRVNTAPAGPSAGVTTPSAPAPQRETAEEGMERIMSEMSLRPRSNSIEAVRSAPRNEDWWPFRSADSHSTNRLRVSRVRDVADAASTGNPGVHEHEWLVQGLATQQRNFDEACEKGQGEDAGA